MLPVTPSPLQNVYMLLLASFKQLHFPARTSHWISCTLVSYEHYLTQPLTFLRGALMINLKKTLVAVLHFLEVAAIFLSYQNCKRKSSIRHNIRMPAKQISLSWGC